MGSTERPADRGKREGRHLTLELGEQVRRGRVAAGLAQADVARACAMSRSKVGRIERGQRASVGFAEMAQLLAVVGLRLWARAVPHGDPYRDVAHTRLLHRLREQLPPDAPWHVEVPLPNPGDPRSWDALTRSGGKRVGIEAETRGRDAQELQRRVNLKRRDGGVDRVILLLADTRHNRAFVRDHRAELAADFPMPGGAALEALREGRDPGDAVILL